jgi:AraC-like DNA-binding protein
MTDATLQAPVRRPHRALDGLVSACTGYHHVLDERAVHHGLPSCSATLVIAFDEPLDVGWHGDPSSRRQLWTVASGMHLTPAMIHTHGHQHGIQLDLTPRGVQLLLGVPMGALASQIAGHEELPLGVDGDTLDRLVASRGWGARFDVLEEHLLRLLGDERFRTAPEVAEAWRLVQASGGRLRTREIAGRVGWSERHLRGRFAAEYGVGPKQASRVARFERARRLAGTGLGLAEVAVRAGYADQAHLNRDWRALAALTPTETLGDPFRFVQDQDPTDRAPSYP